MPGPDLPHEPLVSVVTIFRDEERFLQEAIESVLAQTYANWELLLVDDGSVDRSPEIARAVPHPAVRLLQHSGGENRGMSASRNLALRHARGEYLALLDGDDAWFPDSLARMVPLLGANPAAAMAYGSTEWWRSWRGNEAERPDTSDRTGSMVARPESVAEPPSIATLVLRDRTADPCNCAMIFRTEALRAVGGFEEPFRDLYEDQVLFFKIVLEHPAFVTEAVLGRYRQHDQQACVTPDTATKLAARVRFLRWLRSYVRTRRIADEDLWSALDAALAAAEEAGLGPEPEGDGRLRRLRSQLRTGVLRR